MDGHFSHPDSSRAPAHMCRQGKTAVSRGSLRQMTQSSVGHQGPQKKNWAVKWGCLKMLCTPKPNGFADHYPVFKWLFHWEY